LRIILRIIPLGICIVKNIDKLRIISVFLSVFTRGNPLHLPEIKIYNEIPGVEIYQTKKAYLESEVPLYFHGDAEIISSTPIHLEVIPKALKVIVPEF